MSELDRTPHIPMLKEQAELWLSYAKHELAEATARLEICQDEVKKLSALVELRQKQIAEFV